jgi:hypothetical protein
VLTTDRRLTYRELADEVAVSASELGGQRRLVLLETRNDTDTLVNYLGALAGRHVVLPLPADGDHTAVIDAYDPDVIVRGGVVQHRHRPHTASIRICTAAVHVGQHRFTQAGAPFEGQPRRQRRSHRHVPRHRAHRQSRNELPMSYRLWFVEVVVWILVALALVCWASLGDRVGGVEVVDGLAARHRHGRAGRRLVGYFGNPNRELLVFTGLAMLIWLPAIRCPSAFTVLAGFLAEASLLTYLVHYQVYTLFGEHRLLGVAASIGVGVVLTQLLTLAASGFDFAGRCRSDPRRLLPLGDETLLHQGGRDRAVGAGQAARDHAAAARRRWRRGFQQVPVIGPHGPVKPDRRVRRTTAVGARHHRVTVHLQRGVDHVHVAHVGRDDSVQQRVIGHGDRHPPPQPSGELLT